jgi:hypothetical protein
MRHLLLAAVSVVAACNPVSQGDVFATIPAEVVTTTDAGTPCTPAQDRANWPVRMVFVVQNSGAMCIVDPPGSQGSGSFCEMYSAQNPGQTRPGRLAAIHRFFTENANRPNVSAAVVSYGMNASVIPFSPTTQPMPAAVDALQGALAKGSNLQGALEATKALIEQDVQNTPASIRARSRYVVVVLSIGVPFPRCSSNDSLAVYASATNPALTWSDSVGAGTYCNTVMAGDPDFVTGFTAGGDLNQNAQLVGLVDGMLALDAQYGLGDVRVFTRLLLDEAPILACGPICMDVLGQSPADTRTMGTWLLTQLATRGQGTFADPGTPAMLSLSSVDTSEFTTFCGP